MNNQDIKEKIHRAAEDIPIPDSLSPESIEKQLEHHPRKHTRLFPGQKRPKSARWLAAACLVLLAAAGFGLLPKATALFQQDSDEVVVTEEYITSPETETGTAKSSPEDYEALCGHINSVHAAQEKEAQDDASLYSGSAGSKMAGADMLEESASENSASAKSDTAREGGNTYSETDLQVKGIMEADVVKTDGSYIYALANTTNGFRVQIYSVHGAETKKISAIKVKKSTGSEMYLEGNTLILLSSDWNDTDSESGSGTNSVEDAVCETGCFAYDPETTTNIRLYDVSAPEKPRELRHLSQSGYYSTSRFSNGYLYTFSNYYIYNTDLSTKELSKFVPKAADSYIPADKIKITSKDSCSYLIMTSLNLSEPQDFTDCAALLGGGDAQYMNSSHIYTVENYTEKNKDKSIITKYAYEHGRFTYKGKARVKGSLYDSYYMHEYKDNFVFVYTCYSYKTDTVTNGLCVLNDKMELIGQIGNLGIDEDIYASYFIDNMAYFVTYRDTDPVFAVDISNPENPKLCSELKLPGFSSYLHSFGENLLLGIGYGTPRGSNIESVKLSLFSIDKNNALKEIDKVFAHKKHPTGQFASSNHKCVFIDEERNLAGLMIEHYNDSGDASGEYVVYQNNGGKLKKVLSCPLKLGDESTAGIRGLRIGSYFYIVLPEQGKIVVYDMNTWKKAK